MKKKALFIGVLLVLMVSSAFCNELSEPLKAAEGKVISVTYGTGDITVKWGKLIEITDNYIVLEPLLDKKGKRASWTKNVYGVTYIKCSTIASFEVRTDI